MEQFNTKSFDMETVDMSLFSYRMRFVLDKVGLPREEFARNVDYSKVYIDKMLWKKSTIKPSYKFVKRIEDCFSISAHWLLTGEGSMMLESGVGNGLNPEEVRLIVDYRRLNKSERKLIDSTITLLLSATHNVRAVRD